MSTDISHILVSKSWGRRDRSFIACLLGIMPGDRARPRNRGFVVGVLRVGREEGLALFVRRRLVGMVLVLCHVGRIVDRGFVYFQG